MLRSTILLVYCILLIGCYDSEKNISNIPEEVDFYEKCRAIVIEENNIGEVYTFKKGDSLIDELSVVYLGNVITRKGDTLKIINSINFTGYFEDARKANPATYIYNSENHRIGYYYVGHINSLPKAVKAGNLVFKYNDEDCDQETVINLHDSIPNQIYIRCKTERGDLFKFSK